MSKERPPFGGKSNALTLGQLREQAASQHQEFNPILTRRISLTKETLGELQKTFATARLPSEEIKKLAQTLAGLGTQKETLGELQKSFAAARLPSEEIKKLAQTLAGLGAQKGTLGELQKTFAAARLPSEEIKRLAESLAALGASKKVLDGPQKNFLTQLPSGKFEKISPLLEGLPYSARELNEIQKITREILHRPLEGQPQTNQSTVATAAPPRIQDASPNLLQIEAASDLGNLVKKSRKKMLLSQQQFADLAGVGRRFVSELENGKPSLEFDKVLSVCNAAGLEFLARRR